MTDLLTLVEHVRAEVLASAESATAAAGHLEQLGIIAETAAQDAAAAEHDLACWIASLTAPGACSCHGEITAQLGAIRAQLDRMEVTEGKILMSQSDIDAATSQIQSEVTDLGTQDAAILAAQNAFTTALQAVQGQGVNTTALVAATAQLLQAQGADDSTVAALTAASQPATPAPAPAVPGSTTGVSN